jgi:uncharacterized membrane protein
MLNIAKPGYKRKPKPLPPTSEFPLEMEEGFGARLADNVAAFGGSWNFIVSFLLLITVWILFNVIWNSSFDPYPFILLNLLLSCVASLQAPVIMMSQNRQEAKDRKRSQLDYMVNMKAESEIEDLCNNIVKMQKEIDSLHQKIDQLLAK